MRFTKGYWLTKENYTMSYATQWVRTARADQTLKVLAACKPIRSRGDILNSATLDVEFSAPMENVIRVKVVHFAGVQPKLPQFELREEAVQAVCAEEESKVSFRSGALEAVVHKLNGAWQVDFMADGRLLTQSGYHGMAHALDKTTGKSYLSDSLLLDVGECVYGLGERFGAYVKNGQTIDMWNADGGTASEYAYKNVPFYMTNRGYGVFVEDTADVSFEVASEKVERVQFSVLGETLTYDIIYGGTPKGTLERYTRMTGRPALPPAWSFGLWLTTSFTTSYDEKTTSSFIQGMADRDIPLHVFHFDCYWMRGYHWCDFCWDPDTFPDPQGMLARYKARGLHICCWINPYIGQASPLFAEGMQHGYLLKKTNGDVWQTDLWQAGMGVVDVTNPAARDWYCCYLKKLMDMGVDCFKTDFGERIPVKDIAYFDGSDALHMHNYYTFVYNKMVFELLERERGKGDAVLFARSATAGGQQFPVHWGGDNSACYASMAETLRAGLSISHSGFGFWSHDISGFEQTAPADVYKRWAAFGLLSSHSRLHGSSSYRVPWMFDDEACDVVRQFTKLKCALMPYLYGAAVEAHQAGTPMLRPMMLEFPGDPGCDTLDRQYMLGGSLLVAPVFSAAGDVDFYLPEGEWTNLLDGHVVVGGGWRKERHGFQSLPLMVREGSLLAMGAHDDRPDYDYADDIALHLYQFKEGQSASCVVPALDGAAAAWFEVTLKEGKPLVKTDSAKPYHLVMHNAVVR